MKKNSIAKLPYVKALKTKFQLADTMSCFRTTEAEIVTYLLQMKNKRNAVPFNNRSTSTDQSKERPQRMPVISRNFLQNSTWDHFHVIVAFRKCS